VCVYSLGYPAHNALAPYCHLSTVSLYHISPHYLINGTIFEKRSWKKKTCYLYKFAWNISHSKKNSARYDKCTLVFKYPFFLLDINETCIFSTDFRKCSNIKFHENPSSGSRVVPCGRTDRRTSGAQMTKVIFAFRNFWKMCTWYPT